MPSSKKFFKKLFSKSGNINWGKTQGYFAPTPHCGICCFVLKGNESHNVPNGESENHSLNACSFQKQKKCTYMRVIRQVRIGLKKSVWQTDIIIEAWAKGIKWWRFHLLVSLLLRDKEFWLLPGLKDKSFFFFFYLINWNPFSSSLLASFVHADWNRAISYIRYKLRDVFSSQQASKLKAKISAKIVKWSFNTFLT